MIKRRLSQMTFAIRGIPAMEVWRGYEERQWWDSGRFHTYCRDLLSRQLAYAATHVPYYRHEQRSGSIEHFPVLDRSILAHDSPQLMAADYSGRRFVASSSGSSGRVVSLLYDPEEQVHRIGSSWRGDGFDGQNPWTPTVSLWGVSPDAKSPWQRGKRGLQNWLLNTRQLDALSLDAARVRRYHALLSRVRPARIVGYVHALRRFATIALELGLKPLEVNKIIPAAEELDPLSAEQISAFFHGRLMPRYGCREAGDIAHMCERGRWHIHSDHVHLEVLRSDGSIGESGRGRLLITKLHNRVMPLVRYDIGDLATLGGPLCDCGRSLPVLSELEGRVFSHLLLPDGTLVSPFAVTIYMKDVPIRELQIVQEDERHCLVLIVPRPQWEESHEQWLLARLREWFRGQLDVRIELVEAIPLTPAGKQLLSVNRLMASRS